MCRVLKLFRLSSYPGSVIHDMDLTETKVCYIIIKNYKDVATEEIAHDF